MKTWTVMLIPHDRTSTRTLTVSAFHFVAVPVLFGVLAFLAAFLFARQQAIATDHQQLKEAYRSLEIRAAATKSQPVAQPAEAPASVLSEEQIAEVEARLRAEYESSIAAITSELSDLYDMEAKARDITGMAPRKRAAVEENTANGNGKGGPESFGSYVYSTIDESLRPPHVIYGLSRPSADLILQEIRLRRQSIQYLVSDMEAASDKVERIPSIWPLKGTRGKITSRFGYRRDPFNYRLRHHDGVDVSAPTGTPVVATAKGVVVYAGRDGDYGNIVRVDHGNGIQTWYAHLSSISVKRGDKISRQDMVGKVGSTGRATGAHLHFEVHVNGRPVDGEKYLD